MDFFAIHLFISASKLFSIRELLFYWFFYKETFIHEILTEFLLCAR